MTTKSVLKVEMNDAIIYLESTRDVDSHSALP